MKIITASNSNKFDLSDSAWNQIKRAAKGLKLAQSEEEIDKYNASMENLQIINSEVIKDIDEKMVEPVIDPYAPDAYGERSTGIEPIKTIRVVLSGGIYLPAGFTIKDVEKDIEGDYREIIMSLNSEITDELYNYGYSNIIVGVVDFSYDVAKADLSITEDIIALIVVEVKGTKTNSDF